MEKDQIIRILTEYADVLHIKNFALDFIRQLGWWLIRALCSLCDFFYDVLTTIYKALDFTGGASLLGYSKALAPLLSVLLVISIVLLGYYMIVKRTDARVNLVQNILLIMLILTALPQVTGYMTQLTTDAVNAVSKEAIAQDASPSFNVVKEGVIDLKTIDKQNIPAYSDVLSGKKKKNSLSSQKKISYVDINEYMDYENDDDLKNPDLWKSKLSVDGDGETSIIDMDGGFGNFFGLFSDKYYRYSVKWWTIIITLACSCIALFFMSLKVARIIWEIAAHQLIGPFIAVTDIASGQRMKEFLRSLVSLFAVLFMIMLMYGMYFLGMSYIDSFSAGSEGVNAVAKIIMQMALAWIMIDGANIIERVTGVDAGLKSGYQAVIGALAAGKAVKGAGKMAGALVSGGKGKHEKGKENGKGGLKGAAGKALYGAGRLAVGKKGMEDMGAKFDATKDKVKDDVKDRIDEKTDGYGAYGAVRKATDKADARKMGPDNRGGRAFYDERKTGRMSGIHSNIKEKAGADKGNKKAAGSSDKIHKKVSRPERAASLQRNDRNNGINNAEKLSGISPVSERQKGGLSSADDNKKTATGSKTGVHKKASKPERSGSLKQERNMTTEKGRERKKVQKPERTIRKKGGDD